MSRADLSSISAMDAADSKLAKDYIQRTKQLREQSGRTQEQMAELLGIPVERYKKYETRSVMPPYHIGRFMVAVGLHAGHLVGGPDAPRRRSPRKSPS